MLNIQSSISVLVSSSSLTGYLLTRLGIFLLPKTRNTAGEMSNNDLTASLTTESYTGSKWEQYPGVL